MKLQEAKKIADDLVRKLKPHCVKVEIAGSIRRERPEVGDIEIVAIPKPYDVGLFASGIAEVVEQYPAIKGQLPCRYTQRVLPEGIKLDLFFADAVNWGLIYAIRTGSARFAHKVLARRWVGLGYESRKGYLHRNGEKIYTLTERGLFERLALKWVEPWDRE